MRTLTLTLLLGSALSTGYAATVGPDFIADYTRIDLGSAPGVPTNYGGITFKAGDPNTLLLGGAANGASGVIWEVGVTRGVDGHINGFGSASIYANAPGIDGGLIYGPGGILFYTTYSNNSLGQIKQPCTPTCNPDKVVSLSPLGVSASTGTLGIVPVGFGGAGVFKIISYSSGDWYDATLTPDGTGTYNVSVSSSVANVGGGPEGVVWVKSGNPGFLADSVLVSSYSLGQVLAYDADSNGNPISGTGRVFVDGLSGAEGATFDPLTGDFLFSTFGGGNSINLVRGFNAPTPEPGALTLLGGGIAALALLRRKRA